MTVDPLVFGAEVDRATGRLFTTAEAMSDADLAAPSRLPGWTRGHVLTHIARNADSHVNLLTWARTGVETPQYADLATRDAEIEAGAGRSASDQVADLRAAVERLAAAYAAMSPAAWSAPVRYAHGDRVKAAHVVWARLREVEVHHVDLGMAYRPDDWSPAFTLHLLHEAVSGFAGRGPALRLSASDLDFSGTTGADGAPTTVRGPARTLAAWLIGRSAGETLDVDPAGPLPPVPAWR